jgi:vacuolar-type H+-ATPase subunit H
MRNKALLLVTLLIASGSVPAEESALGNAGKQLLKDTATSTAPKEAVEGVNASGQMLENAKNLKGSVKNAPNALKGQAQDIATETAKQKLNEAVPEKAKQGIKTIESTTDTAKQLKGSVPKSTGEATEAIKGKAQEEATKKALDMLQ